MVPHGVSPYFGSTGSCYLYNRETTHQMGFGTGFGLFPFFQFFRGGPPICQYTPRKRALAFLMSDPFPHILFLRHQPETSWIVGFAPSRATDAAASIPRTTCLPMAKASAVTVPGSGWQCRPFGCERGGSQLSGFVGRSQRVRA